MKGQEDSPINNQKRLLNVIVLADNRQSPNANKINNIAPSDKSQIDFRSSAFKETQVDPLQFPKNDFNNIRDEELLAQLNRRICDLQSRVQILQGKQSIKNEQNEELSKTKKHKIRRKNAQMKKDRICSHCGKYYGTDTALKYHVKLKHDGGRKKEEE